MRSESGGGGVQIEACTKISEEQNDSQFFASQIGRHEGMHACASYIVATSRTTNIAQVARGRRPSGRARFLPISEATATIQIPLLTKK